MQIAIAMIHIHRDKGGVIHLDANFFNWGYKVIFSRLFFQNGCKQLHKCWSSNGGAKVEPSAIPRDADVQITTERRVPEVYGRQAFAAGCGRDTGGDIFRRWGHDILSAHISCHLFFLR